MKKFLILTFLVLFSSNALALDIAGVLESVDKKSANSINKGVNDKVDEIVNKFEGKADKVIKKFEGQVDEYKKEIDGEIKKYRDQIKEVEATLNKMKQIRDNADSYIRTAKIILAILGSGIFALLFLMYRIWRNIVTMKKVIRNVANYEDIEKRLKAVEKALKSK